ncbi:MAG: hypothetical protein E7496_09055 [Ruminococcus sp.]|nr:hypothetical protein [Ruminococcus sp.]
MLIMKFQFILGGCGCGKSQELMQNIKNDLQKHQSVILIVPQQFSFEAEKRLYDFLDAGLFNRMKVYSFETLSQEIFLQCGSAGRNYASEQEKLLFLYQAVQECTQRSALKMLGRQNTPEALENLQKLITKMRMEGITAEKMQDVSPVFEDSVQLRDKTQDIAEILTAYDRILKENNLCDNLNNLTYAGQLAGQHDFFRKQNVYLDEFGVFSGDQYQMLDVMMHQADSFTIAVRADKPGSVPTRIFEGGNQTFLNLKQKAEELCPGSVKIQYCPEFRRSAYPDLKAVATQILRSGKKQNLYQNHVHVFQADDPVSEVEYICATIYHLLSEYPGMHCRDIAIAVKEPAVYRPLLERAFARYHLPYDIATEKSVLHTELIRYFLVILEILSSSGWHTEMILKYLKNTFSGYDAETADMLEHFCFTWSIDRDDWTKHFWEESSPELNQRSKEFGGEALEALRLRCISELQNLKALCKDADIRKICRILYQHLADKKTAYEAKLTDVLKQNEFTTLWELLGESMNIVVQNMGARQMPLKDIYKLFVMLLKNSSFSTPPETLDSIRVIETLYEILTVRLNSPAVVFVPGVSDKTFPGEVQTNSVFSQQELEQLEAYHIRIAHLLPELYSDELLIINKILASPSEQLYLTYPEINAEHEFADPSVIIGEIVSMFPKDAPVLQKQEEISLAYYAWTKQAVYFHFVRNLHQNTPETSALRAILEKDPVYSAKVRRLTETNPEQQEKTSPEMMHKLLGKQLILSPSGIETFYNCPFSYFCRYCLRLYTPEKITLTAQNIGNFAHYCLEKILGKYHEQFTELTEQQLLEEIQALAETFKKENFSASVLRDGRFRLNYEINIQSIFQLLKHMQTELQKSEFIPVAFEEKLGEHEACQPYSLRDGAILCKGKIDRVDVCKTDDQLLMRVVDYKTGKKFLSPEKLADGLDMQMLVYLFALEQQGAFGTASPAGVLYLPSGQPSGADYDSRDAETRSKEEILHDFYQMKGLLADDAVKYMKDEISHPAPVMKHTQNDILFSVTQKQLQNLRKHIEKKICEMADRLYQGDTAPNPYLYQQYSPCEYCQYADICGHAEKDTLTHSDEQNRQALHSVFESNDDEDENQPEVNHNELD